MLIQKIIPSDFEKKYGITLSNPIFLRLPTGAEWRVSWIKRNDDVLFLQDWKKFAHYWSLKHPDFLVFKYEGESLFEVRIFDPYDTCEINYSSMRCTYGTTNHYDEVVSDDCIEAPKSEMRTQLLKKRKTDTNRKGRTKDSTSQRTKLDKREIIVGFDANRQRGSGGFNFFSLFIYFSLYIFFGSSIMLSF